MGNIAFWATVALNIPDFSRYAKSNGSQFWGQMIGMPVPMAFCAFVGAYFAQATKLVDGTASFDPTTKIPRGIGTVMVVLKIVFID